MAKEVVDERMMLSRSPCGKTLTWTLFNAGDRSGHQA